MDISKFFDKESKEEEMKLKLLMGMTEAIMDVLSETGDIDAKLMQKDTQLKKRITTIIKKCLNNEIKEDKKEELLEILEEFLEEIKDFEESL